MTNYRKDIHYSTDLESAVLGACLLESTAFGRVFGVVTEDVFYHDGHKTVFKALLRAWEDNLPIDTLTLISGLCRAGNEELEGFPTPFYICRMTNAVVS